MIKNIQGNLLDCDANILVQCCNCLCVMGAGIAAQIAKKYPEAVSADNQTKPYDRNKLGTFTSAITKDHKIILNLYGQYTVGSGRQLNYEAFYSGLEKIKNKIDNLYKNKDLLKKLKMENIILGFPAYIGCGLAGGSWLVVENMIIDIFDKTEYDVKIVEYDE